MTAAKKFIEPRDYEIYNDAADRAVNFINGLRHTKGKFAGQRFNLRPWQEFKIIRPIFGLLNPDGTRQIRKAYVEIPRKNGKSEIGAAIALKMLCADGEHGAEVYSAAADKDQASLVFNVAAEMVRNHPELSKRCKIVDSQKRIIYKKTGSIYRALSSEAFTKHGLNASAIIYDEIHAAPDRELYDVLTTSMGTREQPLTFMITTAGFDKDTLWGELHDYAFDVRDGEIDDPTFLPVLYAAPDEADWKDRTLWGQVNPALGDFRKIDEMEEMAKRAEHMPSAENAFRQLYLCQKTEQQSRWFSIDLWDKWGVDELPDLTGRDCYLGVDLADTTDVAALVALFPGENKTYSILPKFYVPEENMLEREKKDKVPYKRWKRDGHLIATEGNVIDYDRIREDIKELATIYNIKEIAIDPWNATQLMTQLISEGFTVVPIPQNMKHLNAPSKEFEGLLLSGRLCHNKNAVLRWMAKNVAIIRDHSGCIRPSKDPKKGSKGKIDGIVALILALGRAMLAPPPKKSVYEKRGIVSL